MATDDTTKPPDALPGTVVGVLTHASKHPREMTNAEYEVFHREHMAKLRRSEGEKGKADLAALSIEKTGKHPRDMDDKEFAAHKSKFLRALGRSQGT